MTILNFMNQRFERIIDTQQALRLLRKFETLSLPNLGIKDKYQRILSHYSADIDCVSRHYQRDCKDPPVARDLPPIAGEDPGTFKRWRKARAFSARNTHCKLSNECLVRTYTNDICGVLLDTFLTTIPHASTRFAPLAHTVAPSSRR